MDKLLVDSIGDVVITNDGATVLGFCLGWIARNPPIYRVSEVGFISEIAVGREHQRRGVGRALVDEAMRNNLNLRIAATQIDAAAAAAVVAGARLKPTVNMGLGATGSGTSSGGSGDAVVGLGTTWEIDVWGKLASGAAAAEASLAATQANYEFGRQSLAAQTAKGWFIATQARMLLNLGQETVDLYQQTLDLVNTKYEVGQVTMQDVHLAKADLASSEEAVRQAQIADKQAIFPEEKGVVPDTGLRERFQHLGVDGLMNPAILLQHVLLHLEQETNTFHSSSCPHRL